MAEATTNNKEVEEGKLCAILAWIFPIGLIWYLVDEKMKKNSYIRFNVQQSLVLAIVAIALSIVLTFVIPILGLALLPLAGIIVFVAWILDLLIFILWIIGLIGAINGTKKELPVVGKYGSKFGI